jgi:5-methyltetrahydrofolate--homocysteine methyltransferase
MELVESYTEQIAALTAGGCHIIFIETIFDTLNARAAIYAYKTFFEENKEVLGRPLPLFISGTIIDAAGRTLSGQNTEAFYISMSNANPFCIGFNCALGAEQMFPFMQRLSKIANCNVHAYPNAGLPNAMGGYDETPESFAASCKKYADDGIVNMLGGCCGTTPAAIKALAEAVEGIERRQIPDNPPITMFSGMTEFIFTPNIPFVNIGERCNISGSIAFKKLIKNNDYEKAIAVAKKQVEDGAQILDFNLDDGLIDGVQAMTKFTRLALSDPDIASVPLMIDSSKWEVIEAGLQNCQGKAIVNSISLKEGEEDFLHKAREILKYGAGVVVMAFDENGQATELADKVAICERAYKLLTEKVNFPPQDIIFDTNILTIATGLPEHNNYAVNFIEASRMIRDRCPHVHISGGLSNLSFSFRGLNDLREAFHSVFLYHAIGKGMDMGIVNAGQLPIYEDIDPDLRKILNEVTLNKSDDNLHVERLIEFARVTQEEKEAAKAAGNGAPVKKKA